MLDSWQPLLKCLLFKKIIFSLLFIVVTLKAQAQIQINDVRFLNTDIVNPNGRFTAYLEIENIGNEEIDIQEISLELDEIYPVICNTDKLPEGKILTIFFDEVPASFDASGHFAFTGIPLESMPQSHLLNLYYHSATVQTLTLPDLSSGKLYSLLDNSGYKTYYLNEEPELSFNTKNSELFNPFSEKYFARSLNFIQIQETSAYPGSDSAVNAIVAKGDSIIILSGWKYKEDQGFISSSDVYFAKASNGILKFDSLGIDKPYYSYSAFNTFNNKIVALSTSVYSSVDANTWLNEAEPGRYYLSAVNDGTYLYAVESNYWLSHATITKFDSYLNVTDEFVMRVNGSSDTRFLLYNNNFIIYDGYIWNDPLLGYHVFDSITITTDFINLERAKIDGLPEGLIWNPFIVFNDKVFCISGYQLYENENTKDIYSSKDGINFSKVDLPSNNSFRARHAPYVLNLDSILLITGGYSGGDSSGLNNDVWYFYDDLQLKRIAANFDLEKYLSQQKIIKGIPFVIKNHEDSLTFSILSEDFVNDQYFLSIQDTIWYDYHTQFFGYSKTGSSFVKLMENHPFILMNDSIKVFTEIDFVKIPVEYLIHDPEKYYAEFVLVEPVQLVEKIDLTSEYITIISTDDFDGLLKFHINDGYQTDTVQVNLTTTTPFINSLIDSIAENTISPLIGYLAEENMEITLSGEDAQFFLIDGQAIRIGENHSIDYESKSTYELKISAKAENSFLYSKEIIIIIKDINEAPIVYDAVFSIDENTDPGFTLGFIDASDPENDTLHYSIVYGNEQALFWITNSGEIILNGKLDYYVDTLHILVVSVSDGEFEKFAEVKINVLFNNQPPKIVNTYFEIKEDVLPGSLIGNIDATDRETSNLVYEIISENSYPYFQISNEGDIVLSEKLDYFALSTYTFFVNVSDGELTTDEEITVKLLFVNQPPEVTNVYFEINEDAAPGTLIGNFKAKDRETENLIYEINSAEEQDYFEISNQGDITLKSALDYFNSSTYKFSLHVSDGELSTEVEITVKVLFVNQPPKVTNVYFEINEDAVPGTVVGNFNAKDREGDDLTYQLLSQGVSEFFHISDVGDIVLITNLDYFISPLYHFLVELSDGQTNIQEEITIKILFVNQAPRVNDVEFEVLENTPAGTLIGVIEAYDRENDNLTFSIKSADKWGLLSLYGNQIFLAESLYFTTTPDYRFIIAVSDGQGSTEATLLIRVVFVNKPPTDIYFNSEKDSVIIISKYYQTEDLKIKLTTEDIDSEIFTYSIAHEDSQSDFFSIKDDILFNHRPLLEANRIYLLRISTFDGEYTFKKSLTIISNIIDAHTSLKGFPNPSKEIFSVFIIQPNIERLSTVEVFTINGKSEKIQAFYDESNSLLQIDVSKLKKGTYILYLTIDKIIKPIKFIKD